MIFAIPNPQKNFQISRDINSAKESVKDVQYINAKYKLFKQDDLLNIYSFETTEFLSIGALIIVTLTDISENKINVNIEVQIKIGTFNQSHEVNLANQHISKLTELISESLQTDKNLIAEKKLEFERKKNEPQKKLKELENKRKEMKENRPEQFYAKEIIVWGLIIGLLVGIFYFIYKVFLS